VAGTGWAAIAGVTLRSWYVVVATVVGVAVYAVTLFMGVYLVVQGYALEGILILGLAACGLPLIIGWMRTERRLSRVEKLDPPRRVLSRDQVDDGSQQGEAPK
jgi:type VI protein secretion system component VasK